MSAIRMPSVQYDMVSLKGGLDLVTPTLSLNPGVVRDGLNFECSVNGGYSRIGGYERYDGLAAPSAAMYSSFDVSFSGVVPLGETINGASSGSTAVVISTTASSVILTKVSGAFTIGENLRIGATVFAILNSVASSVSNAQIGASYAALAADYYRSLINKPAGSGPVRGVYMQNGTLYAFRNNAGGTALIPYKATSSGWTAIPFYKKVSFTAGNVAIPSDGATITQGIVSATVKRVCTRTGGWAGTAAGSFVITTPSGGNFTAGAATLTGGATVTLSGAQTTISLLPGGHCEFAEWNFGGTTGTSKIYCADGVNPAFEFDGDVIAPISTGMTVDSPKHIAAFKNFLVLSFGASVQLSSLGLPFTWSPILGAAELSAGERVVALQPLPGDQSTGALLIQTRNNTKILYGSDVATFKMTDYNIGVGALDYTTQNLAGVYSLDDRGIMALNASLNYGNFDQASLSASIRPFIIEHRAKAQASITNREKSQYRIFFSDGYGLYATIINDKFIGALPVYFPDPVFCAWEGEDGNGNEVSFVGSADGYVYQLDSGTSFDGQPINSYVTLNYNAIKGPRLLKRFRKASAEITGSTYAQIGVSYSLGYGSDNTAQQSVANYAANFSNGSWDSGLTYDSGLVWDGKTLMPSEIELAGTGENIAVTFFNNTDCTGKFTINSLIIHYTARRGIR